MTKTILVEAAAYVSPWRMGRRPQCEHGHGTGRRGCGHELVAGVHGEAESSRGRFALVSVMCRRVREGGGGHSGGGNKTGEVNGRSVSRTLHQARVAYHTRLAKFAPRVGQRSSTTCAPSWLWESVTVPSTLR